MSETAAVYGIQAPEITFEQFLGEMHNGTKFEVFQFCNTWAAVRKCQDLLGETPTLDGIDRTLVRVREEICRS
jgi:hypothetical protein